MTKITIPYVPPDLGPNSDFQTKLFRKNREAVLRELRCLSGIPEIARTLNPDTVYKIVCSPEGGKLYTDTAGNLKGVFYRDGKIVQHAKLRAVGPSLVKCATAVASQILLIHIAIQLHEVKKAISTVIDMMYENRLAKISSGVAQYEQAMSVQDSEFQLMLIANAIQTLNDGLEETTQSLKRQIAEMPEPEHGLSDNWPIFTKERTKQAEEKFRIVEESFQACIIGIQTLAECFATRGEPGAADSTLAKYLSKLSDSGIASAAQKARLVPFRGGHLPEQPLRAFLDSECSFHAGIEECGLLANNEFDCIEVEFKPIEFLEGEK